MQLHMKSKVFSLHSKMEILNEEEQPVYHVSSKVISIHNMTYVKNAKDEEVATITRKPISLHETHFVEMANGFKFEMRTEWFHIMQDIINIEELGWRLHGDFMQHNYEILDSTDRVLAKTHMKWFSIHKIFYIDIEDESHIDQIIALYVALERIIQDRIAASESSVIATTTATTQNTSN